jgi:hypothetical protein
MNRRGYWSSLKLTTFSSDFLLTTRALHWDRGRLARSEHRKGAKISQGAQLQTFCSRCALGAGEPPAVPVKNSSGQAMVTKGLHAFGCTRK